MKIPSHFQLRFFSIFFLLLFIQSSFAKMKETPNSPNPVLSDIQRWCLEHNDEELCEHDFANICKNAKSLEECLSHFKLEERKHKK